MDDEELIRQLEWRCGFAFDNPQLYLLALTHPSYANEQKRNRLQHNERLEFLGDSVLGLAITAHLYCSFPHKNEGELSRLKSYIVSAESLAEAGREYSLGPLIRLGRGEVQNEGAQKDSVLANAVEALFGACYLDQGWEQAQRLVLRLLRSQLDCYRDVHQLPQAAKLQLQEYVQKNYKSLPQYQTEPALVVDRSTSQNARPLQTEQILGFEAKLYINRKYVCSGQGRSKKQAEKRAAEYALKQLESGCARPFA